MILMTFPSSADAQNYIYEKTTGEDPFSEQDASKGHPLRGIEPIIEAPANDELSEWIDLPFTWSFFGQPVTGFYASDNGYITFNRSADGSVADHSAVPSPEQPNDAIYAFWGDWHLDDTRQGRLTNSVGTVTTGEAPNRKFSIAWIGVAPNGQAGTSKNTCTFYITLHEGGGFDIAMMAGKKTVPLPGTVGVENYDGSAGTMAGPSPNYDFPALTASPNDDLLYEFSYSDRAYAASVTTANIPDVVGEGQALTISGEITNRGSKSIESFEISTKIGDEPVRTQTVNNLDVATNNTASFEYSDSWSADEAGALLPAEIWVSKINGEDVAKSSSETFQKDLFVNLGKTAEKKVLVEEFTGAWCGWCPDGAIQMNEIENKFDNAVLVSIHAGGNDAMIIDAGQAYADTFSPPFPAAMIDRKLWDGEEGVPINRTNDAWIKRTEQRLEDNTPVKVQIDPSWDGSSRKGEAAVTAEFVDYPYPGDLRLNLFVIEDRVTGEGTGYDQVNYYSQNNSFPDHMYYSESNPIEGYVHRHVLRAVPSGTWGTEGVISGDAEPGTSYSHTYTFSLPENIDESEITLVGFVSYHSDDHQEREVLNAAKTKLTE